MPTPRLIGLAYSPWSIKAKWALDHHAIPYRYTHHLPMLGEPLLRLRTGRLEGRVSVPLLVTDAGPIEGSFEIARFAERERRGRCSSPPGGRRRWSAGTRAAR
ncbi:MAG: glutathione S-transferase domain-containing protein [Sandaracinaceae bacterium]|nr:glutathione S-transferase domain-containing protein [Sandaracinaceae bacterium]